MCSNIGLAQSNVGIGTNAPTEKLEVGGIIYTNDGGVRFPDLTLQETAAFMSDPEDAGTPNGAVFLLAPVIASDTIWLLDISQGGFTINSGGGLNAVNYRMIKEMDATSPKLMEFALVMLQLATARLYFTDSMGTVYQTIEMRDARLLELTHQDVYQGNGTYAHLETLEFSFIQLEIENIGESCYCWDFMLNTNCVCD
jgi:hypothetical protein